MKRIILGTVLLLAGIAFSSQVKAQDVPDAVQTAFQQKYPGATDVKWNNLLVMDEATFKYDNAQYRAKFSPKGEWQLSEKTIDVSDLPEDVKVGINKSKYNDWQINSASILTKPDNVFYYKVEVQKNTLQKKNLFFNKQGQLQMDNITL